MEERRLRRGDGGEEMEERRWRRGDGGDGLLGGGSQMAER